MFIDNVRVWWHQVRKCCPLNTCKLHSWPFTQCFKRILMVHSSSPWNLDDSPPLTDPHRSTRQPSYPTPSWYYLTLALLSFLCSKLQHSNRRRRQRMAALPAIALFHSVTWVRPDKSGEGDKMTLDKKAASFLGSSFKGSYGTGLWKLG